MIWCDVQKKHWDIVFWYDIYIYDIIYDMIPWWFLQCSWDSLFSSTDLPWKNIFPGWWFCPCCTSNSLPGMWMENEEPLRQGASTYVTTFILSIAVRSASSFFVDSQTALCPQDIFSPEWWKLRKMMHRIHYWQDDIVRRMWGTVRSLRIKIVSHSLVLITTCWFYIKMNEALSFVQDGQTNEVALPCETRTIA